jgi:hypothetical protein
MNELAGKIIARVSDYGALVSALRARSAELNVRREVLDSVAGLQQGYSAKLLSPVPSKSLGRVSLGPVLQALGLAIVLVEDAEALARVKNRFGTPERRTMRGGGKHNVITIRVSRRRLAMLAKRGGIARAQKLTAEQRSDAARRAAKARWQAV